MRYRHALSDVAAARGLRQAGGLDDLLAVVSRRRRVGNIVACSQQPSLRGAEGAGTNAQYAVAHDVFLVGCQDAAVRCNRTGHRPIRPAGRHGRHSPMGR